MLIILILAEDNSLFALLMKIDKAIQDNDGREYIVNWNGNEFETPLQQRCQIMHTESLQEAVSASANNDFPTIALLSRPGLYPIILQKFLILTKQIAIGKESKTLKQIYVQQCVHMLVLLGI